MFGLILAERQHVSLAELAPGTNGGGDGGKVSMRTHGARGATWNHDVEHAVAKRELGRFLDQYRCIHNTLPQPMESDKAALNQVLIHINNASLSLFGVTA